MLGPRTGLRRRCCSCCCQTADVSACDDVSAELVDESGTVCVGTTYVMMCR